MKRIATFFILLSLIVISPAINAQHTHNANEILCGVDGCDVKAEDSLSLNEASLTMQMKSFFSTLFDTSQWPPRWRCGEWSDFHGWFYILSDVGIWAAYFAIPLILGLFLYKKKNTGLPFPGIFLLFMLFILACGLTHLTDAIIFWIPVYKFSALIRFLTAIVSIGTVFALIKVTPKVMEFKSPEELERIIQERTMELEATNEELASTNEELSITNETLKNEIYQRELAQKESIMIFESLPQLAWVADENGEFLFQNAFFKQQIGEEYISISELWDKFLHPEDQPISKAKWKESVSTGKQFEMQERIKYNDGNYYWVLTRALPIKDADDKIIKWIGTSTNIHEQKIAEQRKDTFLNIASHELKTPLTIISAYAEMCSSHELENNDEVLKSYINKIKDQTGKLDNLINELLDVSKIDTGKMEYELQRESFDEIIKESVDDFKQINKSSHTIKLSGKTNKSISCDTNKINQVMFNLLSNAVKYSDESTTIHVKLWDENSKVYCTIEDEGAGISEADMKKIFTRFYRTKKAAKSGGLGLGLYISQEITKKHGGNIIAKSTPGKGSEFTMILPVV